VTTVLFELITKPVPKNLLFNVVINPKENTSTLIDGPDMISDSFRGLKQLSIKI